MGKKIDVDKLRDLVDEATFRKIILECGGQENRLVTKYGQEVTEELHDYIKSLLDNHILLSFNGKVYALPLRLEDGKELKLYYRSKTDTEF